MDGNKTNISDMTKSNKKYYALFKTKKIEKPKNKSLIQPKMKEVQDRITVDQLKQNQQLIQQLVNENQELRNKSQTKIRELQDQIKKLKAQIERKNKIEDENIGKCKVCLEKPAIFANVPCMHVNLCVVCAEVAEYKRACITCRQVGEYKKIFF